MKQQDKNDFSDAKPFIIGVLTVLFHFADRIRAPQAGISISTTQATAKHMVDEWEQEHMK